MIKQIILQCKKCKKEVKRSLDRDSGYIGVWCCGGHMKEKKGGNNETKNN